MADLNFTNLMNLADCDYKACVYNEQFLPDEFAVRIVTYHLQQAIKKSLKAIIMFNGGHPSFTHDIDKLVNHAISLGEHFVTNTDEITDTLTLWESKSRYDPYITFKDSKYKKAKAFYVELSKNLSNKANTLDLTEENTLSR